MNYRKLTLLIALSIVIVFAATAFLSPSEDAQAMEIPQTMETEDPFPSTTTSSVPDIVSINGWSIVIDAIALPEPVASAVNLYT